MDDQNMNKDGSHNESMNNNMREGMKNDNREGMRDDMRDDMEDTMRDDMRDDHNPGEFGSEQGADPHEAGRMGAQAEPREAKAEGGHNSHRDDR